MKLTPWRIVPEFWILVSCIRIYLNNDETLVCRVENEQGWLGRQIFPDFSRGNFSNKILKMSCERIAFQEQDEAG